MVVCVCGGAVKGQTHVYVGGEIWRWKMGREFLSVSKMLVVTGYSSLNSVVHDQDFEEKKKF